MPTLRRLAKIAQPVLTVATFLLPNQIRFPLLNKLFGWNIASTATIGLSLIRADALTMADHSRIGHFNVVRDLQLLRMQEHAVIGQWNWISAAVPLKSLSPDAGATMAIGPHAALTSRHYIDASGGVTIGAYTTVAGVRSTMLTHQIDTTNNRQTVAPITIAPYCFIGSNVAMLPGSAVPSHSVVAMGSVVTTALREPETLYAGVPAKAIKPVDGQYFTRKIGYVV